MTEDCSSIETSREKRKRLTEIICSLKAQGASMLPVLNSASTCRWLSCYRCCKALRRGEIFSVPKTSFHLCAGCNDLVLRRLGRKYDGRSHASTLTIKTKLTKRWV